MLEEDAIMQFKRLIYWDTQPNSSSIWAEHDGFDINSTEWQTTVLGCNAILLLNNINVLEIVENLQEDSRQTALRWQFDEEQLWNDNYDHEQLFKHSLCLYTSRMNRFTKNIEWSRVLREAAIFRGKQLRSKPVV